MLTSTYAALYKTTSPLTLDWRSNEVAAMMGNDTQLIKLFCNIKTEMFWFRMFFKYKTCIKCGAGADFVKETYRDFLFPEDTIFRTLVLDNENKLVKAQIKAAKRQGIL